MTYHYTEQPRVFVDPHKIASFILSSNVNSEFLQRNLLLNVCDELLKIYSHIEIVQEMLKSKLTPLKNTNIASIQFFNQNQTNKIITAIDSNIRTQWSVLMDNHKFYESVLKVSSTHFEIKEHKRYERLFRFVTYINLLYLDLSTFFKNFLIAKTDYERWFFVYRLNVVGYEGVERMCQLIEDFTSIHDNILNEDLTTRLKESSAILSLLQFNKELRNAFVDFQNTNKGQKYIQNMKTHMPAKQVCVLISLLLPELNNLLWTSTACVQAISQELKKQQKSINQNIKTKIQSIHTLLLQYAKSKQEASNINSLFDKLLSVIEI